MHVNEFKCYKWILQSSVLVILTSWIQKCLWIWRIVLGGMISSPSFTYSLVSFSPATHSMHSASKPDFPEKDKLLLLFFLFLSLCLLLVFIISLWGNSFCPGIVVIFYVSIFYVLFMFSKAEFYYSTDQINLRLSKMIQRKPQLHKHSCKWGFNCQLRKRAENV